MIRKNLFLFAFFLSIPLLAPTWAEAIPSDDADSSRADMLDAARREILGLSAKAVPPESLGEWKDVTDSACFTLFRRTELYRGPMRAMVISSREIIARIYPEGTLVLSTGLFDSIDDAIFESAAASSRRMKDISGEREARLVPFIAFEAARFALDLPYRSWRRHREGAVGDAGAPYSARVQPSADECQSADGFALTLLGLAEYSPESYTAWLASLSPAQGGLPAAERPIDRYRASFLPVTDRLAAITASRERIQKVSGEFSDVIAGLKTRTAFRESVSSANALRESFPDSPYLSRLEALTLHELWLSTVTPSDVAFLTVFPLASETEYGTAPTAAAPGESFRFPQERTAPPGDATAFHNAIAAYRKALALSPDPTLESSFASLLVWSEKRENRQEALHIAAEAASSESGNAPFETRANYASTLFLTGVDRPRAIAMLERLTAQGNADAGTEGFLIPQGIPGDERELIANLSGMYRLMGNAEKAEQCLKAMSLTGNAGDEAPIAWRGVRVGDSSDELVARWGEPDEIAYNVYTETWRYRDLKAAVRIVDTKTDAGRIVKSIRIVQLSPLSPGEDIRTGDTRAEFETVFGKPAWYANDEAIYRSRGNTLSVLYLSGRVRSIAAGM
ncbi:MAG TPA: hypothetical protein PKL75_10240 [Treponemataceae bacterium]|nr:hypothetical protein [Treponemataceae bacterium]